LGEHSDLLTDRDKQKQLGRVVRQMDRMHSVLEYDRLNIGKDISLTAKGKSVERNRLAIVMKTEDEHAFAEINNALASVSNEPSHVVLLDYGPLVTFLVTDNLKSELFSEGLSPFVREMNARHVIYHHIHDNLADCGYGKGPQEGAEELARYSRLFVLNWVTQVMRDGSLMPPFLMAIKRELMFDVLLGRKSIFVYFDGVQFAEFVNEIAAGKFTLTADGHADREWSGLQIKIPGRKTKGPSMLGWGVIFRMLIEFQGPETVRRQIVEMVEGEVSKFAAMKDTSPGVPKP
jgi:hypothetical protein